MKKNKINQLYKNAWNFTKSNNKNELDFDDSVYSNLLSELYANLKSNPLFCDDIMIMCTDKFINDDYKTKDINENRGEELIGYINKILELNQKPHYLLIPINGARLSTDIHFHEFHFITGDEIEKIDKIHTITGLDTHRINDSIEHTKKSRSKDFLKHPTLVLQIDNVHSNVHKSAPVIAQKVFQIIKLMVYSNETREDIFEMTSSWYDDNYYVAILGEENWQFGHRSWWNLIRCKYSLDFLSTTDNKNVFVTFYNAFICNMCEDELYYKFLNALELFAKSLEQYENYRDTTLSTMLLFSAAESLLTESLNEKKLRLSVIWPRLVTIGDKEQKDLCLLIRDSYEKRNDFVHAGNLFSESEKGELRILHQMLAKLICQYLVNDKWRKPSSSEKEITKWRKFVGDIFTEAIYN